MRIGKKAVDVALCAGLAAPRQAHAQDAGDYPNRPIRVIVPVGAGAGMDTAARVTAAAVEKHIGQTLVIENKPGAGRGSARRWWRRRRPTVTRCCSRSPSLIAVAEHFPQKMDFEPAKDFGRSPSGCSSRCC